MLLFSYPLHAKELNPFAAKFYNPLMIATQKGSIPDIASLIDHGYNVNTRENNITPLLIASYTNNLEVVKYLIDKDVDVNSPDYEGNTPLHIAHNYPDVVNTLIQSGADPFKQNKQHKNAIELMIENGNENSIQILNKHNILNNLNNTERNKLLKLAKSSNIKQLLLSDNNNHDLMSVLAKEDFIELPTGSNIIISTDNNIKDKKTDITSNAYTSSSFFTTTKNLASTQPNQVVIVDNNVHSNENSNSTLETVMSKNTHNILTKYQKPDTEKGLDVSTLYNVVSLTNNINDNGNTNNQEASSASVPNSPIKSFPNNKLHPYIGSNKLIAQKTTNTSATTKTPNNSYNNLLDQHNSSFWVEIKYLNTNQINIVNSIIKQNIIHPLRIQTIKSLSSNNLVSIRVGPINSFDTARNLCYSTESISNYCIITDKLSIQTF